MAVGGCVFRGVRVIIPFDRGVTGIYWLLRSVMTIFNSTLIIWMITSVRAERGGAL